jgi:outer membrane protein OmpA-like peptidoglycan-associated protein
MSRIAVTGFVAGVVVVLAGALAQAQERVRIDVGDDRVDTRAIVEQLDKAIGLGETRSLSQPSAPRVSLMLRVEFAFGSSGLTGQAAKSLEKVAGALNDPKLRGRRFVVEGHTDAVGTDENNTRLSRQRAATVVAYLEKKGITTNRLAVSAMGKRNLLPGVAPADGRNRRVDIVPTR